MYSCIRYGRDARVFVCSCVVRGAWCVFDYDGRAEVCWLLLSRVSSMIVPTLASRGPTLLLTKDGVTVC